MLTHFQLTHQGRYTSCHSMNILVHTIRKDFGISIPWKSEISQNNANLSIVLLNILKQNQSLSILCLEHFRKFPLTVFGERTYSSMPFKCPLLLPTFVFLFFFSFLLLFCLFSFLMYYGKENWNITLTHAVLEIKH